MTYSRGAYGADSASTVDYATEKASGYQYHFRYSAGVNNTASSSQFKLCKVGEIAEMVAAGVDPVANFEASGERMAQGAVAGAADGVADLAFWQSRGLAKGASIYGSVEPGTNQAEWDSIAAFRAAYSNALQGYYLFDGLYDGIPALQHFSHPHSAESGIVIHGWIPGAASVSVPKVNIDPAYAPPAKTNWDLWFPTKSQVTPALNYLQGQIAGSGLTSCIWQDGNQLDNKQADEDIVLLGGVIGSHLEALGGVIPTPPPVPPPTPPAPVVKLWQNYPIPSLIARGTNQYLGSISGPAASHGGINATERGIIKVLQQRLIVMGFVNGVTNPNSGWADGIFDTPADRPGTGATSQAVARFQHDHMPQTTFYGQCWYDDWVELFNILR